MDGCGCGDRKQVFTWPLGDVEAERKYQVSIDIRNLDKTRIVYWKRVDFDVARVKSEKVVGGVWNP
jgi:hypothetical protein